MRYLLIYLVFIAIISACSPAKHDLAWQQYHQAMSQGDVDEVIVALAQLTAIDKNSYQHKLKAAQTVKVQLHTATNKLNNNDYFAAYLLSHHAYRSLPLRQSKTLLVVTGKELIPLLKAHSKITQSFALTPAAIKNQLKEYQQQPVNEWHLIAITRFITALNNSAELLRESANLVNNINFLAKNPELLAWKKAIEQRLFSTIAAKASLIKLAQATSAKVLLNLNGQLVAETANLLSLVSPPLAKQSLQPLFLKAQTAYQPYQILNENLALADAANGNNNHAAWYQDWQAIEQAVLHVDDSLVAYPKASRTRMQRLNSYENNYVDADHIPIFNYQNEHEFMAQHQEILSLIQTLTIDETTINYGLAINVKDKI